MTPARSARRLLVSTLLATAAAQAGSEPAPDAKEEKKPKAKGWDFCEWIQDDPGVLYEDEDSWFLNKVEIGGRFHYQAAYLGGKDINGRHFHDTYDEYRRARIESKWELARFFTAEVNVNLVDDRRFRDSYPYELDWGYDTFDTLTLELDLDKALDLDWLDKLELTYGKMKLKVGEENHQSSREILTIERSAISDRIGGDASRPTGGVLAIGKDDFDLTLGVFSGEDDADVLGSWNDGLFYYASLAWEPEDEWRFVFDQVVNDQHHRDMALGFAWVSSLSGVYEEDDWGILVNGVYGDNGGDQEGNANPRRQGDFWGGVVMPWYWILEDKLQFVCAYQYQRAQEEEGIRLDSRYIRARHDDPLIDVENGRGDRSRTLYAGLNYYICDNNAKIMGGISRTNLDTRKGEVSAWSYLIAFRTYF
ncbi:porin [Haloferula sargassicola]|uniref:Phosphate-selective porin O and P n=1 Tax=Haloferula sargassicola TaxID=490096 RepID=A0ABP9UN46_9BACT